MEKGGAVYMMSNFTGSTIYTGVTSDLLARVVQHKEMHYSNSFTARYKCFKLVYYESFHSIEEAIAREKQIKGWKRFKKVNLIEAMNPNWNDLTDDVRNW